MYISEQRLRHELRVAKKMRNLVLKHPEICSASPDDMFSLGYLHDCGKGYGDIEHARVGGEVLKREGFRFWKEVSHHGNPFTSYHSPELDLLNWADMTVTPNGKDIAIEKRLEDVERRYGRGSKAWKKASAMSENIRAWCEKWKLPTTILNGKEAAAKA